MFNHQETTYICLANSFFPSYLNQFFHSEDTNRAPMKTPQTQQNQICPPVTYSPASGPY